MSGVSLLIARFLAWGDVLLTLPLLETLHASRAVARVDVLTMRPYAQLLGRSRYIRNLFVVDPDRISPPDGILEMEYDLLVDLHTRAAPLAPAVESLLTAVRARARTSYASPWQRTADARPAAPSWTVLPTRGWDEHAVEYYARSVASLIEGPIASGVIDIAGPALAEAAELVLDGAVCVAPGARYEFKQWPQERYVRLIRRLAASGIPTILVGHSFDAEIVARIRSATGAPAVIVDDDYRRAAVLRAAGVVVANNSGMAHLAQVAGARVVCVHSHTSPVMWRPWGDGHVNLVGRPGPCACPGLTEFELPVPCGKGIEPESVADAVAGLVGQAPVRLVAEGAGR